MMETLSNINNIVMGVASFLTAILVIVQTFTKHNPFEGIRNWFNKPMKQALREFIKEHNDTFEVFKFEQNEQFECIKVDQKKLRIDQLRLIVASESMPLPERVKAGDEYVNELGQNGEISVKYAVLRERLKEQLRGETRK